MTGHDGQMFEQFRVTQASEEDSQVYSTIMGKLDAFLQVQHNVIFERAQFNYRNQLSGEQYIMALYTLAANSDYGTKNRGQNDP